MISQVVPQTARLYKVPQYIEFRDMLPKSRWEAPEKRSRRGEGGGGVRRYGSSTKFRHAARRKAYH
jgi:hypothetical protein